MSISSTGLSEDEKKLVTSVKTACFMLDCGPDRVYQLLNSGELESYLDGRSRKILVASLKDYIARRLAASKTFKRARYPARKTA